MGEHGIDTNTLLELLDRSSHGDDAAMSALIRHSGQRLESLARRMLRGYPALRRWIETGDVLQNALVRLVRALEDVQVQSARHFMALSALQIRRELIDLARHYFGPAGLGANHDSRAGSEEVRQLPPDPEADDEEPDSLSHWCELHEQIASLPETEREVFDLIYYEGLSQADTARMLDVSVRTVQRRWQSALLLLHEKVAGNWPDL